MDDRYLRVLAVILLVTAACNAGAPAPQITASAPTTAVPAPTAAVPIPTTQVLPSPTGTRPAHGGIRDQSPAWSPDGTMILFATNPSGGGQIWAARADGTGQPERLVSAIASQPTWSPDGRRISFASPRGTGRWDIYIKDLGSGVETRLTTHEAADYAPAWSPDGSRIAFYRFDQATNRGSIVVARVDGSGEDALAAAGNEGMPQWSPDGSQIAFQSERDGNWEIYVMRADGTRQTRLTTTPDRHDGEPSWSPDGAWVLFSAGIGPARDIYAIHPDGTSERRLTHMNRELWAPRVSPDGTRIAFYEFPPGRIYLAQADGSQVTALFGY